ncbi:APC family permease [Marisediminicola senii]|uniref:APC family permease n=1 Tax=Marisediminicola senii TaxID=2711233 RepID=UPI0013EA2564|nr:amino acid permease [Marisediminicola senii]
MSSTPLARRLGLGDAVVIGLGSMIGAGVFAALAPAAQAAGGALLWGLAIAAVVAFCNATSSAQLAAAMPRAGGTYLYGRERLGPWWGFAAGWSFVIGKTASCAAMAMTFAAYVAPAGWERPIAVAAVIGVATVGYRGVTRTARVTRVIVVIVLAVLALVVVAGASTPSRSWSWSTDTGDAGLYGVLQSAGILFFAFAGYARIATMGEEVRDPARVIPRAIVIALAGAMVVYAVIATTALVSLGPPALAASTEPLADVVTTRGWDWAVPVVMFGAGAATLGALLGLVAGIGRTGLAMARESDLPRWLDAVHPRFSTPHRAEATLAVVVCAIVLTVDLRDAIAFSSFGVLLYYLVANIAALTQGMPERRYPRALAVTGAIGCVTLVATLPAQAIAVGIAVLLVGVLGRAVVLRRRPRAP